MGMRTTMEIVRAISPYCDKVVMGGKHVLAYPKGSKMPISMASTAAKTSNQKAQVFRDFRRRGIIINELKKS